MELQVLISKWLTQIATYLPFGYSFGAGMVSAVNPCGFAMLPVYLTLYLGAEDSTFYAQSPPLRMLKALGITVVVTSGFGLLFGVTGGVITLGGTFLHHDPLAVPGGRHRPDHSGGLAPDRTLYVVPLDAPIRRAVRRSPTHVGAGFFLFGAAFGATSMSCTLPIFLLVMGSSIARATSPSGSFSLSVISAAWGLSSWS